MRNWFWFLALGVAAAFQFSGCTTTLDVVDLQPPPEANPHPATHNANGGLFSAEASSYVDDLDDETIPPGLREAFATHGYELAKDAAVVVVESGQHWIIKADKVFLFATQKNWYRIKKATSNGEAKLHIYRMLNRALEGPVYYLPKGQFDIEVTRTITDCGQDRIGRMTGLARSEREIASRLNEGDLLDALKDVWPDTYPLGASANLEVGKLDDHGSWFLLDRDNQRVFILRKDDEDLDLYLLALQFNFNVPASVTPTYIPDTARPFLIDYEALDSFTKKTTLKVGLYDNGTLKFINAGGDDRSGVVVANTVKGAVKIARMVMGVPSVGAGLAE